MTSQSGEMTMATPALQLAGLTRRFGGVVAVDNISVTIPKGEIVGLVGDSYCGSILWAAGQCREPSILGLGF